MTKIINEAKGHLDHPEDDVFIRDDVGTSAIKAILDTAKSPKNITIKWDGYPALIFGRGTDGKFTIVDKHMFNRGVRNLNTLDDWIKNEQSRGENTRTGLIDIVRTIWPDLEKITTSKGYYWGDLLFGQPLKEQNGSFTFRANPNGITYKVDADSEIGKLLAGKTAAIAVHQFLSPDSKSTDDATSLNGSIGKLTNTSNIAIVPSAMPTTPSVNVNKKLLNAAVGSIRSYGNEVKQYFDNAPQNKSAFTGLFTTYLNSKIVSGNLQNLVGDFVKWIENRFGKQVDTSKVSASMGSQVYDYISSNTDTLEKIFKIWIDIYNLKSDVVTQLDKAAEDSPVKGYLQDGTETHEGFVSHGYKFVNRMGFARQNLAGRTVNEQAGAGKTVVIMPGGFHPFHAGHYALYQSALKAFPNADVYVAATNDTSKRPFPFQIKEKLAKLAGVPAGRFVQVASPFNAEEITSKYDPESTVLVYLKSSKNAKGGSDPEGPFPAERDPETGELPIAKRGPNKGKPVSDRLQYYKGNEDNLQPMSKHSYLAYLPTVEFGPGIKSATEIRNAWPTLNEKRKIALIMSLYPKTQSNIKLAQTVVSMLDNVMGDETVTESIQVTQDYLEEK